MPNHVHGIVVLTYRDVFDDRDVGAQFIARPIGTCATLSKGAINRAPTLGAIVRGFKARITNAINGIRQTPGAPVWQRNYYEHIIRAAADLNRIRQLVTLMLSYRLLHRGLRFRLLERIVVASSLTHFDFWRRYRAPKRSVAVPPTDERGTNGLDG